MKDQYRMPDGKWTTDAIKMARAWKRIYRPIEKRLGVKIRAFDPDISFMYGNKCFELPVDVAVKVCELIKYEDSMFKK